MAKAAPHGPAWGRLREKRLGGFEELSEGGRRLSCHPDWLFPSSFASLFEDRRACSYRQAESQKIEMIEQRFDPGNPAFRFCAQ